MLIVLVINAKGIWQEVGVPKWKELFSLSYVLLIRSYPVLVKETLGRKTLKGNKHFTQREMAKVLKLG